MVIRGERLYVSVLCLLVFESVRATFNTKAWQSVGEKFTFPEIVGNYPEINSKKNVGITFSGGGDRSYTATIGYLAAFHELGYVDKIRYIAGSSGGSWATVVYTYLQHDDIDDNVMLGKIVFPQDIIYSNLSYMEPGCVRAYTNSSEILSGPLFDDWVDTIQAIYFTPAGINQVTPFSYNSSTVADIKARNTNLASTTFQTLRGTFGNTTGIDTRPFPIIQGTLIGPEELIPYIPANRNYSLVEWTPLSAGVAYSSMYVFEDVNYTESIKTTIGGFIEPFAFNTLSAPSKGLSASQSTGNLVVPGTIPRCDLALASGTSSWAVGCAVSASSSEALQLTVGSLMYWSPSELKPTSREFTTGDGAGVSNTNLISLLQRGVTTIFAFPSSSIPLQNSTNWDPLTQPLTEDVIDFTVPAWFGEIPANLSVITDVSYDLKNSHVFENSEWIPFITALQAAQAKGNGNIISMNHTTVRNVKYGIKAGMKVKVVWIYLGRALNWEKQLSDEMKALVIPKEDASNQANTIKVGPFSDFPHYPTLIANINPERANLMADLVGWTIYQNQNLFREALGMQLLTDSPTSAPTNFPTPAPTSSDSKSGSTDNNSFASSSSGIATFVIISVVGLGLILGTIYYFIPKKSVSLAKQDSNRLSEMILQRP